jgi:hypothetical protein
MGSEIRRPGMPSGLDAVVEEGFHVPVKPNIGRAEAEARVRSKIEADGMPCERLDLSELPVQRDSLFDMTGARVTFPKGAAYDTCYVALIDPSVEAQWGHPAHWAFVPVDGSGEVAIQPTNFPENAMGAVRLWNVPLR